MMEEAKIALIGAKRARQAVVDKLKRIEIGRLIESIEAGGEEHLVKLQAKRIALDQYFTACIMDEVDPIEQILKAVGK
jgi:hypothetical protein